MSTTLPPRCKSCHVPILWVLTTKGRKMPLDPEPVAGGTFCIDDDNVAYPAPMGTALPRYSSHFATCIHAASHRKPRRR